MHSPLETAPSSHSRHDDLLNSYGDTPSTDCTSMLRKVTGDRPKLLTRTFRFHVARLGSSPGVPARRAGGRWPGRDDTATPPRRAPRQTLRGLHRTPAQRTWRTYELSPSPAKTTGPKFAAANLGPAITPAQAQSSKVRQVRLADPPPRRTPWTPHPTHPTPPGRCSASKQPPTSASAAPPCTPVQKVVALSAPMWV